MPTYDYVCVKCEHEFETFQGMNDAHLTDCPECKKKSLKRLIGGGAGLIFKGTGFYETDYKTKSGNPDKKEGTSDKKDTSTPTKAGSGGSDKKESKKSPDTSKSAS